MFIEFFVNPFVGTASTFLDSLFNSFSTNTCFVLFKLTFLFSFFILSSKHFFLMKLIILVLLAKFACANLAVKLSDVNLLNYWVVI